MKRLIFIAALVGIALTGCKKENTDDEFVPVTDITGVSSVAEVGKPLTLAATVSPSDATSQTIALSVKEAGTTGATVNGATLNASTAGTVTVTATISGGAAKNTPFTKDFAISVKNPADMPTITGVTVSPATTSVAKGGSKQFTATVYGTKLEEADKAVNWTVTGSAKAGTVIAADGTLTIADDETATNLTVKATSAIDNTKSGMATVTVTAMVAQTIDVYTAGCERDADNNLFGMAWKNGEVLYDYTLGNELTNIFVTGNDVYVSGWKYNATNNTRTPKVWKNGAELYTFEYESGYYIYLTDLYVSGNDVYVTTYETRTSGSTTNYIAKVWKNGSVLYNLSNDGKGMTARGIYVLNNDVYVCGNSLNQYNCPIATVWKNGNRLFTFGQVLVSGSTMYCSYGIKVIGNTVYASCTMQTPSKASIYKYNGSAEEIYSCALPASTYLATSSRSLDAEDSAPDVVYWIINYSGADRVFKGNSEVYTFSNAGITDLAVKNGDVYLSGYKKAASDKKEIAAVWKNGEELFTLTDGTYDASANSIFVVAQ